MVDAARLKARAAIALGDCFAVVTAAAHDLTLLTGDPEILDLPDSPCRVEDLRPGAAGASRPEGSAAQIADWGPAEDWADWKDEDDAASCDLARPRP